MDEQDKDFKDMMWGVKPLNSEHNKAKKMLKIRSLPSIIQVHGHSPTFDDTPHLNDAVKFIGAHQKKTPKKHKIKINRHLQPNATLDLHGFTLDEAENKCLNFIAKSISMGHQSILIITGKGLNSGAAGAVLKVGIWDFLSYGLEQPLDFQLAPAHLGGEGAILILL
ncbi:MAG: Smr/MutS family protein [SAR324 cluster bacterium]|nr:Smr/MutS family protein [SAR324 cluster bacterium]